MRAIWSAAGAGGEWRGNKYNSGSCSVYPYNSQHCNLHQNTAILASVCSAARSCLAVTSSTSTPRPSTRLAAATTIVTAAARGDMATTLLRLYCLYCPPRLRHTETRWKASAPPPFPSSPAPGYRQTPAGGQFALSAPAPAQLETGTEEPVPNYSDVWANHVMCDVMMLIYYIQIHSKSNMHTVSVFCRYR